MIHIYNSHSLDQLAHRFSEILQKEHFEPLEPIWIVVQNNEVKEWLSLQLASKQGIAGNFRFIFPSEFMWALYRLKDKDIPKSLPSDLSAMHWALFDLFGKEPKLLDLIPVYNKGEESPQKRFQLSSQLADVFDQYQVYRPDMTQAWLEQKLVTKNKHEKWQAAVWRQLNECWKENEVTDSIPSRSKAYNNLINWFEGHEMSFIERLPEHVFVFGLSHLNKPFLKIFSHYSKIKSVHFFHRELLFNFSNKGLQDVLSDWNASSKAQFELFKEFLENQGTQASISGINEDPVSTLPGIHVHSCHSNKREVEVLKDSILDFFEKNSGAGPDDVLILVPDAENYISELEASFNGGELEPAIPVSPLFSSHNLGEHALAAFLDTIDSSYKPSMILDLINLKPIKQSFSFSDNDLERLEGWIIDNKIHRGIGDRFNSPFSWQKGLNQLLIGFLMEPGELELYRGLVPYTSISANEDLKLTARFSSFIHSFIQAVEASKKDKNPIEWLEWIEDVIQTFLDGGDDEGFARLYRTLGKLKEQLSYSEISEHISFQIMKNWIKTQFKTIDSTSGRFGHGVTVSSYIPYRSVPFKFVAVLGLNEGVFPRKAVRPEFDLIYALPHIGDRIQKEDDTYLFLEILLATEKHFHVSYQGQDQRSDANRLPSMLVQQLLDVLGKGKVTVYEHKLHPFNPTYYSNDQAFRSYSQAQLKVAGNLQSKMNKAPLFTNPDLELPVETEEQKVYVRDLISFFTDPSKYISKNYLGFYDSVDLNEVSDREPFKLNPLESYFLDDFLLSSLSKGKSREEMFQFVQASGMIPDKLKGDKLFQEEFRSVRELNEQLGELTSENEQIIDVMLNMEGVEVVGKLPGIYGSMLITSRVGKRKPKYEIDHWLRHLIAIENGIEINRSYFLSVEGKDLEILEIQTRDIPKNVFSDYLEWFLDKGFIKSKAAFFPATSKAYAEKWMEENDKETALHAAKKTWEPAYKSTFVESNEYYNRVIWRNQDPLVHDEFHDNALRFWLPFLKACGGGNDRI